MEVDILKQAALNHGTKVKVIQQNRDKYSVSTMCKVLQMSRSTYYYKAKNQANEDEMTKEIVNIFQKN